MALDAPCNFTLSCDWNKAVDFNPQGDKCIVTELNLGHSEFVIHSQTTMAKQDARHLYAKLKAEGARLVADKRVK